ncbi:MAG: ribonuclease E/G [Pseudomonadota bacterium]
MSDRGLYLDRGIGETRGVAVVDGRPAWLFVRRDDEPAALRLGARSVARVRAVEKAFQAAFLDLPDGTEALLPLHADATPPVRGAAVEVEVRGEPRQDKLAVARLLGPAEGAPRLLAEGPTVEDDLRRVGGAGALVEGEAARDVADAAEAEALETVHPLPGGGSIAIEPTRALVAVDVDLGGRGGTDSKRAARAANLAALAEGARLLRLKGLGGLVIFDLVGRGHDGKALLAAARAAFAQDNPGVAIDQVSRFGTLMLTVPRRRRSALDRLLDETGRLTAGSAALRLARALEREGRSAPGARLAAACAPATARAFEALRPDVADRLGPRFVVEARPDWPVDRVEARAL